MTSEPGSAAPSCVRIPAVSTAFAGFTDEAKSQNGATVPRLFSILLQCIANATFVIANRVGRS
jgi:hypothetical protein